MGAPVGEVAVQWADHDTQPTLTSRDGTAQVEMPPGSRTLRVRHPHYEHRSVSVGSAERASGHVRIDLGPAYDVLLDWDSSVEAGRPLDLVVWRSAGTPQRLSALPEDLRGLFLPAGTRVVWVHVLESGGASLVASVLRPFGSDVAPFRPPRRLSLRSSADRWLLHIADDAGQPLRNVVVAAEVNVGTPLGSHRLAQGVSDAAGDVDLGALPLDHEPIEIVVLGGQDLPTVRVPADLSVTPQEIIVRRGGTIELTLEGSDEALGAITGLQVAFMAQDFPATDEVVLLADGEYHTVESARNRDDVDVTFRARLLGEARSRGQYTVRGIPAGVRYVHWFLLPSALRYSTTVTVSPGEVTRIPWQLRGLEPRGVTIRAIDADSWESLVDARFGLNGQGVISRSGQTRLWLREGDEVYASEIRHAPATYKVTSQPKNAIVEVLLHRLRNVELRIAEDLKDEVARAGRLQVFVRAARDAERLSATTEEVLDAVADAQGRIRVSTRVVASEVAFEVRLPDGKRVTGGGSTLESVAATAVDLSGRGRR
jgi:hypothetical protein